MHTPADQAYQVRKTPPLCVNGSTEGLAKPVVLEGVYQVRRVPLGSLERSRLGFDRSGSLDDLFNL